MAIDVAGSIRSKRLIEVLTRLVSQHGAPLLLRSDNGPEFVSLAVLEWLAQAGIGTALAKIIIEAWRRHFNTIRPHSSLNYLTPLEFKQQHHPNPNRAVLQE